MYVRDAVFTGTNASMTPGYADLGSDIMVLRLGFHSPGFLPSRRPEINEVLSVCAKLISVAGAVCPVDCLERMASKSLRKLYSVFCCPFSWRDASGLNSAKVKAATPGAVEGVHPNDDGS